MNTAETLLTKIDEISGAVLEADLNVSGCTTLKGLLTPEQCEGISRLYPEDASFRSHICMARHGFGKGEYKYFSHPLPDLVSMLCEKIYPKLVPIANAWNERMGLAARFPSVHADYIEQYHDAGQSRPTPLLLQYVEGDFTCLHQDVYGDLLFPLQMVVLLSRPEKDFTGGNSY